MGGGHVNYYVLLPLKSWLLLFVPISLFGKLDDNLWRVIFVLVIITHYIVTAIFLSNYPFAEDKGWTKQYYPYAPVIWYLAGQIFIWAEFFNEIFLKSKKAG